MADPQDGTGYVSIYVDDKGYVANFGIFHSSGTRKTVDVIEPFFSLGSVMPIGFDIMFQPAN